MNQAIILLVSFLIFCLKLTSQNVLHNNDKGLTIISEEEVLTIISNYTESTESISLKPIDKTYFLLLCY